MSNTVLYAPTASVLQLLTQTILDTDELFFAHLSYTFSRRTRWTTLANFFPDARFDVMSQQLYRIQEFVIHREIWTPAEIDYIEWWVDQHKGSAYPFFFTAPDDGVTYTVRLKEDTVSYSVPDAVTRSGDLVLVEVGDLDNSINNGLVYPSYVESTTTTTTTSTTSTTT